MKRIVILIMVAFMIGIFNVSISNAEDCEDGNAMLDKAFESAPDEMTLQYIEMAAQFCQENSKLYKRIAKYYERWYKKELNPNRQAEFKGLAENFFRKAIASSNDTGAKKMKHHLAQLKRNNEFNEVAFRALRPSRQENTVSGLKLDVHFDHNSCELSNTVQQHLDILGKCLGEKESVNICLEGHTDMSGTSEYNKYLSSKRAEAVRDFLMTKYNISQNRISVVGYGFERLADNINPYSKVNRRVEVIKLSE